MAGSAHTLTSHSVPSTKGPIGSIISAFTGDGSNGTVPDLVINFPFDVILLEIETNPGATAPTDNYDISLNDADGVDVMHTSGANRDTSTSEIAAIVYATSLHPHVQGGNYSIAIANQSVNDAVGTIEIRYIRA